MKGYAKQVILPAALCIAMLLSGCRSNEAASPPSTADTSGETKSTDSASDVWTTDAGSLFSDRDMKQDYDAADAVTVQLTENTSACTSDAVKIDGSRITLLDEGVYVISGTLSDTK